MQKVKGVFYSFFSSLREKTEQRSKEEVTTDVAQEHDTSFSFETQKEISFPKPFLIVLQACLSIGIVRESVIDMLHPQTIDIPLGDNVPQPVQLPTPEGLARICDGYRHMSQNIVFSPL